MVLDDLCISLEMAVVMLQYTIGKGDSLCTVVHGF
jgi:hypothetical protein